MRASSLPARVLTGVLLASTAAAALASGMIFRDRDWMDADWALPETVPGVDAMIPIPSPHKFGSSAYEIRIDPDSLEFTDELITRYVLALVGERTEHVYYEAIRCASRGWRIYGVQQSDGSFRRFHRVDWQRIRPAAMGPLSYRMPSLWMLLCSPEGVAYKPDEVRARLRDVDNVFANYGKD